MAVKKQVHKQEPKITKRKCDAVREQIQVLQAQIAAQKKRNEEKSEKLHQWSVRISHRKQFLCDNIRHVEEEDK